VLVVEPEFLVAFELEFLLRDFGYRMLGPVASTAAALALLGCERPDAALLDLDLFDGQAVPVAALLATMGVPFALVTACEPEQIAHPLLRQAPRLGKPLEHGALQRMLVALLGTPQAADGVATSRQAYRLSDG
jgi:DNA-binding response OmpR family regulator